MFSIHRSGPQPSCLSQECVRCPVWLRGGHGSFVRPATGTGNSELHLCTHSGHSFSILAKLPSLDEQHATRRHPEKQGTRQRNLSEAGRQTKSMEKARITISEASRPLKEISDISVEVERSMQIRGWLHARMMLETAGRGGHSQKATAVVKGTQIQEGWYVLQAKSASLGYPVSPKYDEPQERISHSTRMIKVGSKDMYRRNSTGGETTSDKHSEMRQLPVPKQIS